MSEPASNPTRKVWFVAAVDPDDRLSESDVDACLIGIDRARDRWLVEKGETIRQTDWQVTVDLNPKRPVIRAELSYDLLA